MRTLFSVITLSATLAAAAQTSPPTFQSPGEGFYIHKISNNGKWGIAEAASTTDGSIAPEGGTLYDLSTLAATSFTHPSGLAGVSDVTDDGNIIVGEAATLPAYYSVDSDQWTTLSLPTGYTAGRLTAVTPDGHYALGWTSVPPMGDQLFESVYPVMYDLTDGSIIDLPGLPVLDMQHEDMKQNYTYDISPDGRYILGMLSQSYLVPAAMFVYVYDRETATYTPVGFTESKTSDWTPDVPYTAFNEFPVMSPDGNWVAGTSNMAVPIVGSEFNNDYTCAFRYHIPSGKYEAYTATNEQGVQVSSVMNDGTVLASTPSGNPYANAIIRSGNYFVTLDQLLRQIYGIRFEDKTTWENTGQLICASEDGRTFVTLVGPQQCYVMHMPEDIREAAAGVHLLADWSISPAEGTVMSKLKTFSLTFEREIELLGTASQIRFSTADGSLSYSPVQAKIDTDTPYTLSLTFRNQQLATGQDYVLTIPEGMLCMKGDEEISNREITVAYTGHDDVPMTMTDAYPADGASVAFLDVSNNPALLSFDVDISITEGAAAYLYRVGEDTPMATLGLASSGNILMIYPGSRVNLFSGTDYRLALPAGAVTDVTGGCGNEEIALTYHGSYVREISSDDIYLFNEDCSSFENFMFYEGDFLTPAATPAEWGFTYNQHPYWVVCDEDSDDMAFATHSMYSPAGQADDWCMTPQLFIPDEDCYLTFDAQSYLMDKQDVLKVMVYAHDNVYNTLDATLVEAIVADGDVVFDEQLSPGDSEERLADEWTNYVVRLGAYAGKSIYIAFVNRNHDQSAIFIDNIKVVRDLRYLVTFENENRVVAQESIAIRGNVTGASEIENFDTVSLTLKDGEGNVLDEITESGLALGKGDVFRFEFDTPLPLTAGVTNRYNMEVKVDGYASTVQGEVKNLTFQPVRHIVLEEYAGRDCSNCPQGIVAIENIERLYPGALIPICVRTYQGDPLGTNMSGYSSYLGCEAAGAPSARINRGSIIYPMISVSGDYRFTGAGANDDGSDETLWLDAFVSEYSQPAEADVQFTTDYDAATNTVNVSAKVRTALNATDQNISVFAVMTEDGLTTYQKNGFGSIDDPDLGEWGKGGSCASGYVYPYTANDVARAFWGNTYAGTGGLVPTTIEAGTDYPVSMAITVPSTVENIGNCRVAVMLIDAVKGTVLNANVAEAVGGVTNDQSGVEETFGSDDFDSDAPVEIYTINGVRMASGNLTPGIYIRRQGNAVSKILVK